MRGWLLFSLASFIMTAEISRPQQELEVQTALHVLSAYWDLTDRL